MALTLKHIKDPDFIIPDDPRVNRFQLELHRERYNFARQFVKGKKVLDAGCGSGYGSQLLSNDATFVIGADIQEEGILYAKEKYHAANLRFITTDSSRLAFVDNTFD